MINDDNLAFLREWAQHPVVAEIATELLQLRAQLAEAEADRKMLLTALRSQVVTAETQRHLLKEA